MDTNLINGFRTFPDFYCIKLNSRIHVTTRDMDKHFVSGQNIRKKLIEV